MAYDRHLSVFIPPTITPYVVVLLLALLLQTDHHVSAAPIIPAPIPISINRLSSKIYTVNPETGILTEFPLGSGPTASSSSSSSGTDPSSSSSGGGNDDYYYGMDSSKSSNARWSHLSSTFLQVLCENDGRAIVLGFLIGSMGTWLVYVLMRILWYGGRPWGARG